MKIHVTPCDSMSDAIQWADAAGGRAILLKGKPVVVETQDAERLEMARVEFAYLCDHEMPDGTHRIVSIPVN